MNALDDVARFRSDDPAHIVAASFACPICLELDAVARLTLDPEDPEVLCTCFGCAVAWTVAVNLFQAMRLALYPPTADDGTGLLLLAPRAHSPRAPRHVA